MRESDESVSDKQSKILASEWRKERMRCYKKYHMLWNNKVISTYWHRTL